MIPLYTTSQIRELDKYAILDLGIPGPVLMENASIGIVEAINEKINLFNNQIKFGLVCGKGNNGGDGYAVARHLSNLGHTVKIISLGSEREMSDDCRLNYNIVKKLSGRRKNIFIKKFSSKKELKFLSDCQVIIDAMLGTGVSGALKSPYNEIINHVNSLKKIRIAIDIPTGLNADSGYGDNIFNADISVTLGEYKRGLFFNDGAEFSGEIILKEIGVGRDYLEKLPVQDYLIEPEDVFEALPVKRKSLHKYSAGKVFVIAGSGKFPGAAVLTSLAALKSGAGSVILAFPESSRKLIQKNLTEVVFESYKSEKNVLTKQAVKSFSEKIKWSDVIAIGPGIDRDNDTVEAVRQILRIRKNKTVILDADGIYAIGNGKYKNFNLKNVVLTPHLGEFSYLIDIPIEKIKEDIFSYGKAFSIQTESYLVLKGAPTIILTPNGDALINSTGNPGMAKFGTG
ncbi:MAG: NAD(P)H-hydrate epimerase, partial [Ignavibacteriaceae bacterium]|nr:NAD(P)H-hydrate epimerase [Ignavibacteriaceae bacterium]